MNTPLPPKFFMRLFRWFCKPELVRAIEGDLIELYGERHNDLGKWRADLRLIADVVLLFRPGIVRSVKIYTPVNNLSMFKNYFKISWRNLLKNKGYSFINLGGLAMGMAVALLVGVWVYDELTYDMHFDHYDRIARVMQNQTFNGQVETWVSAPMQVGPALRNSYGNYFDHVVLAGFPGSSKLTYNDLNVTQQGRYMDAGAPEMLSLHMLRGKRSGLNDPHSILLSESAAHALFGDDDALDKTLKLDDKTDVKVTGVYADLPANSSFDDLKIILPWQLLVQMNNFETRLGWGNNWFQCFVQIAEHTDFASASQQIQNVKRKALGPEGEKFDPKLFLQPMHDWHLRSEFRNGVLVGGDIRYVWMFGSIGVFVLLLACINFMNLSTARSEKRAKEVGIRKTMGSLRSQLVNQFFFESLIMALCSFAIALVCAQLALPWFNEVSGKSVRLAWDAPLFWLVTVGFVACTGLMAGSYPALYLSSFRPASVLKGVFHASRLAAMPRKVLVIVQFTVSVTLIIGTITIFEQIEFVQGRPIGYGINGLVTTRIKTKEILEHYDAFRHDLLATGAVEEVAASEANITATYITNSGFDWAGKDPDMSDEFVTSCVTPEFGKAIAWKITQGRDFSSAMATDTAGFIVNEAAVAYMGLKNPLGEAMKWNTNGEWKIIGVVQDIVSQSPYSPVKPMIFFLKSKRVFFVNLNVVNLKLNPAASPADALAKIETIYKKYDPGNAFEYAFADQDFATKFNREKRLGKLIFVFTLLAIFISGLGLLGLASYVAEQRTKEIGIRKIMGASVLQLWQSLSGSFVGLIGIACLIAMPIAFYFMDQWLSQYSIRIALEWPIFVVSCVGAICITLLIVSLQTIKAALQNPVKSLRSE